MKTKYHILLIAALSALCVSCGGFSSGKALKIINLNENVALYQRLRIGENWITGPDYINTGNGHLRKKTFTDEDAEVHTVDLNQSSETEIRDQKGANVLLNGYYYRNSSTSRCDGCPECFLKYQNAGLLTCEILDDGSQYESGNKYVNVTLTPLGDTYRLIPSDEEIATEMTTNNECYVEMARRVYSSVRQVKAQKRKASAVLEYYIEYSPFAVALGFQTNKSDVYVEVFNFEKNDGEWQVAKKKND